ncbi:hypothetical protein PspLS_10327 [Pyricularia sp. CBS 133598]|nr:hypothetical protein PspLS_10327 [Pyricularia sp. CBS 133598]
MQFNTVFAFATLVQMALAVPLTLPAGQAPPSIRTDVGDIPRSQMTSGSPPSSNRKACKQPQRGTQRGYNNLLRRTIGRYLFRNMDLGNLASAGMATTMCVEAYVGGGVYMEERRQRLEAEAQERQLEVAMGKRPPSPPKQAPVETGRHSGSNPLAWTSA